MRVLVLGTGMVGTHVAKHLLRDGAEVSLAGAEPSSAFIHSILGDRDVCVHDCRILSAKHAAEMVGRFVPEKIVIAAGSLSPHYARHSGLAVYNESNLNLALLGCVRDYDISQVVYVSSFAVYGSKSESEDVVPKPETAYGLVKLYTERLYAQLAEEGVQTTIIRPTGVIGPTPEQSGNTVSKRLRQLFLSGRQTSVLPPEFTRPSEFMDVRDLSRFVAACLDRLAKLDIVNVGNGKMINPEEFATALEDQLGTELEFGQQETTEVMSGPLPTARARTRYEFEAALSLDESLNHLSNYYAL